MAAALITVASAALTVLGGSVPRHDAVRLELGGASDGRFIEGPWSRAFRLDIDPPASAEAFEQFVADQRNFWVDLVRVSGAKAE